MFLLVVLLWLCDMRNFCPRYNATKRGQTFHVGDSDICFAAHRKTGITSFLRAQLRPFPVVGGPHFRCRRDSTTSRLRDQVQSQGLYYASKKKKKKQIWRINGIERNGSTSDVMRWVSCKGGNRANFRAKYSHYKITACKVVIQKAYIGINK